MNEVDEMTQLNKVTGQIGETIQKVEGDASTSRVEASSRATESTERTDCSSQSGDRGAGQSIEGSGARTGGCWDL
jgi:hypothetical protein